MKSHWSFVAIGMAGLSSLLFYGCGKAHTYDVQFFWGEIVSPKYTEAGQPIISNVQIEYETTSFQLNFTGFQVTEKSNQHYTVSASGIITTHGETNANTSLWKKDTTCVIQIKAAGQYIFDYVYKDSVQHTDTVIVR